MTDTQHRGLEDSQVRRAAKLLEKRGSGDLLKKLAVERKIQAIPDHVMASAKAQQTRGTTPARAAPAQKKRSSAPGHGQVRPSGEINFEPDVIKVTPADMAQYKTARGEAETAIGREVERYIQTVQQGHREGYANFRVWYRSWEKAKEESSTELAKKICGFLLEKGVAIIFPEEEVFITVLKAVATKGYGLAADQLGKVKSGDIESFLDTVGAAEESEITALLDAHDRFFQEKTQAVDEAVDSFLEAREKGWATTEKLPPETLAILQRFGIGAHGSAAASLTAERLLSAHIESVLHADPDVVAGAGGANLGIMAEVSALRQMQSLPGVDNREKIYDLERGLPPFFRTMVDINNDPAIELHFQLGFDQDDAEEIVASRNQHGRFTSSSDLLTRKLVTSDELKKVEGRIVCH
jgi:hypothetical protein